MLNRLKPKSTRQKTAEVASPPPIDVLDRTIADRVAPASLNLTVADSASFSPTEWVRIWYVRDWPQAFSTRHWQRILRFPADVRVSMFMSPLSAAVVGRQLEQQATAKNAERVLRTMQKRDQSVVVDRELNEIQAAQWRVQIEGEPFVMFTLVFALFGSSKDDLDTWSMRLEDIFREANITVDRAIWQQKKGLTAMQPLNLNTLGNHQRNMPLDALTQLFPFTGQEVVMKNGAYYGESLETHMSVTIDPFQMENPNTIIIGPPGGGKSYWMKDLITQYVTRGVRAYILDIEGEYELLCEDLGGAYLDMGIKSKHKINVLDPDPEAELPADQRTGLAGAYQSFKEWLVTAIGRPLEAADLPILDRCYQAAFAAKGIYAEDPATLHRPAPILSELYDVLLNEADPYALRLANELYPMARGLEAEAFNCRTNIEVRASPLVVFGLKNVPNPMKARRIRQVQQLTWNQMLTNVNLRPTLEIVDEAWFLLQHAHTASDLAERARRFRKKNGALVIATQHAEDFAHSRSAEAVLEIAASHLLFRQKPNAIDRLALLFKLLPGEARSLVTMRTGDYLFLSSNLRLLLHKQVPVARDELYTTRPSEVQAYRERRRQRIVNG